VLFGCSRPASWQALAFAGSAQAAPTCSGTLPIAVHGQHIIGDYVSGIGQVALAWPPQAAWWEPQPAGRARRFPVDLDPVSIFRRGLRPGRRSV
jgi:hypothetical protein